jgi:hypothetical protein
MQRKCQEFEPLYKVLKWADVKINLGLAKLITCYIMLGTSEQFFKIFFSNIFEIIVEQTRRFDCNRSL